MSEGLQKLASFVDAFDGQLKSAQGDSESTRGVLSTWLVPILREYGMALEQIVAGLDHVQSTATMAALTANQTYAGEVLEGVAAGVGEIAEMLESDAPDMAAVRSTLAELSEALSGWVGDGYEDEDEDEDDEDADGEQPGGGALPGEVLTDPVEEAHNVG